MLWNRQTKRNLTVLLTAVAVLAGGLALTAWAKKPDNPGGGKPGGGGEPPRYTLVYLGTLGGSPCDASAINDAGQVVGGSFNDAGDLRAFLLTPEGSDGVPDTWFLDEDSDGINDLMLDLGVLGIQQHIRNGTVDYTIAASWALDLNDLDQVVGGSTIDVETTVDSLVPHAFIWTDGQMIDLGALGGLWTDAESINNHGEVVGLSGDRAFLVAPETDGAGNPVVWFLDENSDGINDLMIDLGTLGGPYSWARAINDSGQVVGWSATSATDKDGRFIEHAFVITPEYDSDGNLVWFRDDDLDGANDLMIDLGTLGGPESWARAINDSGQIAGAAQINANTSRAFLLTPEYSNGDQAVWFRDDGVGGNALMTDLGTLKGTTDSGSADLNNDAQVVGVSSKGLGPRNAVRKPFLWENGQMKELNKLTDSDIDIGTKSRSINNAGQIVNYSQYMLLPIPAAP